MKKSLIKFLTVLITVLFVFCSCASEQLEIIPEYNPNSDGADLDGLTVTWGFSMSRYNEDVENVFGFKP